MSHLRAVKKPNQALVDTNGFFHFGTFNGPFEKINMLEAKEPLGRKYPKKIVNWRLKEWEAFQAGNKDYFILGAIYNTKVLGINQLFIYDIKAGKTYNYQKISSPRNQIIGQGLLNSESYYRSKNYSIFFYNSLENNEIRLVVDIKNYKDMPDCYLSLQMHHINEPIVICQPFGENRALYSHKALMPMNGKMILDTKTVDFQVNESFSIIDDHKGFYPRTVKYDWVTGWGLDQNKELFGFNLTDNQILDHDQYNENCLWYQGKMIPLPAVHFEKYMENSQHVWHIKDSQGDVDVKFYPETKFDVKINALVVKADYEGPMGAFKGRVKSNQASICLDDCFGMGEKKIYVL